MSTIRQFTTEGSLNWTASHARMVNGALDYIGGGYFLAYEDASRGALQQVHVNNKTVESIKTILSNAARQNGKGVVMNRSFNPKCPFDGNKIYALRTQIVSGLSAGFFKIFDWRGTEDYSVQLGTSGTETFNGICTDGKNVFIRYATTLLPIQRRIRKYTVNGKSISLDYTYNVSNQGPNDLTFEGGYIWGLVGANVKKYSISGKNMIEEDSWAHGATTARGIASDMHGIYILSAS